ncbi:MAG: hypothetical protein AAF368_02525, partial [Planctomycetota bacterium]
PPKAQPEPEDFDADLVEGRHRFPDRDKQKAYDAALKHWQHYEGWRKGRNPKRAELEDRYGYDTKHAMHLVRLLKMGEEVLTQGTLVVRRPDSEWLLGIRDGALAYEALLELSREMSANLEARMSESSLPDEPDRAAAEALVIDLHRSSLMPG